MSFTATCQTADCPEHGVPKPGGFDPPAGLVMLCGECGEPCDIADTPT